MIQPDSAKFLAQDVEARHSGPIPLTEAQLEPEQDETLTQLNRAYICLLLAIVFRGDEGILEATIAQYALLNISESIDVTEAIDQFERAGWISTDWEVLMGESKSLKTRRCKISEAGRQAAEVAEDIFPIV